MTKKPQSKYLNFFLCSLFTWQMEQYVCDVSIKESSRIEIV